MSYPIFMPVYDRPIYLYMTLDALARATRSPYRLYVFRQAGRETGVADVLAAFQRRGVITEVFGRESLSSGYYRKASELLRADDDFAFVIEDDVVIEPEPTCWMSRMVREFRADETLAMIGSAVDKGDFIDPARLKAQLGRDLTPAERAAIKLGSPERRQTFAKSGVLSRGCNVAGRLIGLRVEAMLSTSIRMLDHALDENLREAGWGTGTLPTVRHRHLSLQNYYDYPAYAAERDDRFGDIGREGEFRIGKAGSRS